MNRKHPLLLALSAAMVMGTSAPAFAAEATDAATREDVISLLWQQEGAPVINYALPFTDVADTAADAVRWAAEAKSSAATVTENLSRIRKSQENSLQPFSIAMPLIRAMMFPLEKTRIFSALQMLRISHPMPFPQFSGRMAVAVSYTHLTLPTT
mgnify:CR=1 FL=1